MPDTRNIHWTDDDELVSKFVLHQLPANEENALFSHLSTCEKCRHAVDEEATIVAGAKLAGRAALKGRLRLRLSESQHRAASTMRRPAVYKIPWPQIASVAAVVTIIIAVGVYNDWFIANDWKKSTSQDQPAEGKEPFPAPLAAEENRELSTGTPQKKELASDNSPERDRLSEAQAKRTHPLRENGSTDKRRSDEQYATSAPAEPEGNVGAGIATLEERKAAENEIRLMDQVIGSQPESFWVEGHILPGSFKENQRVASESPRSDVSNIMRQKAGARKDDRQVSKTGTDNAVPAISLRQEPSASLPAKLQYRQDRQKFIQTLIENKNNAIQMTLYLDSPVADSELNSSNIEVIDTDSLVLNLSSQRIGLRLPPALQSQINTKAKQVK